MKFTEQVIIFIDIDRFRDWLSREKRQYVPKKIAISVARRYYVVTVDEILYIEVAQHLLMVHCDKERFILNGNLSMIEEALQKLGFARIHRNYMVSLYRIKEISNQKLKLDNRITLPIGRAYSKELRKNVFETFPPL